MDDTALLREFVQKGCNQSFSEIVHRHIDLVYSVALRRLNGDVHAAKDVSQRVFAGLTRKAARLPPTCALGGWLYIATCHESANFVRTERRRATREHKAFLMNQEQSAEPALDAAEALKPVLDDAIAELNDAEREAVILRFFEGKPLVEVGRAFQVSEEAARKRVDRAVDSLRVLLEKRGIASVGAALALALENSLSAAAPVELATGIAATVGAQAGFLGIAGAATLLQSKFAVAAAIAAVAATATAIVLHENALSTPSSPREVQISATPAQRSLGATLAPAPLARASNADAASVRGSEGEKTYETNPDRATSGQYVAVPPVSGASRSSISKNEVDARFTRARQLADAGRHAEALREYLWCYDEGMLLVPGMTGLRNKLLLERLWRLAEKYPPAAAALRERQTRALDRLRASPSDYGAASDFATLNVVMHEPELTLQAFDAFSQEDIRRKALGSYAFDSLIGKRRYADALVARPFNLMSARLEGEAESPERQLPVGVAAGSQEAKTLQRHQREQLVDSVVKDIEVVAGSGDLESARLLGAKLLGIYGDPETRAKIQTHAIRAGHPELMNLLPR
jgi:RNA polymerase sigma factor (sigma-70 family)